MKILCKPFLIAFVLYLLCSCQKEEGKIYYIDMSISPIRSIHCDSLRQSSAKKQLVLSNESNNKLSKIFSNLKPTEATRDIDARVYGWVYEETQTLNFCMGIGVIEINNKKYFVNDELRDYMRKITTKK